MCRYKDLSNSVFKIKRELKKEIRKLLLEKKLTFEFLESHGIKNEFNFSKNWSGIYAELGIMPICFKLNGDIIEAYKFSFKTINAIVDFILGKRDNFQFNEIESYDCIVKVIEGRHKSKTYINNGVDYNVVSSRYIPNLEYTPQEKEDALFDGCYIPVSCRNKTVLYLKER